MIVRAPREQASNSSPVPYCSCQPTWRLRPWPPAVCGACRACGSRQHCKAPHAAWVAQTLLRPSAPDPGGWVRHAPHGRSPSRRASDAAGRSATCLPTVCRSAALQGPPRSFGSSNFVSALSSRPWRMGSARAPWSLTIPSGLGRCCEVSYVPALYNLSCKINVNLVQIPGDCSSS